ncbi:hypothetical protein EYF80_039837 [Liparis tanakae]|uniref:Uncharacterized protein n=1 Tax=Liparis tanakae TaxID=230148 RepID=A0A4Z2G8U7_9TELE|nr:hypothetical protein EYF80_039837 [Liparis tanakae]
MASEPPGCVRLSGSRRSAARTTLTGRMYFHPPAQECGFQERMTGPWSTRALRRRAALQERLPDISNGGTFRPQTSFTARTTRHETGDEVNAEVNVVPGNGED